MENPGLERLRAYLHRHNRRVLGLTVATFLIAAVLWVALYGIAWWLLLLGGTAARSLDYRPMTGPLVRGFAATGVVLCVLAWALRRIRPNQAPRDHKTFGEHFMDVVLAIPRLTLASLGTSGAALRLTQRELESAWDLLRRMEERHTPVPVQELPVEIPDASMRERVVLALQLSGIIEIRPSATGPVFAFRNEEARRLAQGRVRIRRS